MVSDENSIKCFVIMPFSSTKTHSEDYWSRHFTHFLKPLIEECGDIAAFRSEPLRGSITNQIITDLIFSQIVVADITDYNPNVFWELGVRQSFRHGTITIAEEGTKPPFDITTKGILYYNSDHQNIGEFKKKFQEAIRDCVENPQGTDSQVLEAITGRGSLYFIINRDEILRKTWAVLRECSHNLKEINTLYENLEKHKAKPNLKK